MYSTTKCSSLFAYLNSVLICKTLLVQNCLNQQNHKYYKSCILFPNIQLKKEIPNEGNKNDKTTRRSNDITKQSNKAMSP